MRRIRSKPGMTQMDALVSLQRIAREQKEEIIEWSKEGQTWVAALRPIAEFPPSGGSDDGPDGPPSEDGPPKPKPAGEDNGEGESGPPSGDGDGDSDDEGSSGPPKPPGEKSEHGKGGGEHEIL